MKPFKKVQTQNLGLALLVARMLFILGVIGIFLTLGLFTYFSLSGPLLARGFTFGAAFLKFLPYSFVLLVSACLIAALVSIEETYRLKTLSDEAVSQP